MPCYVAGAPLSSPTLRRIVVVFTDVCGIDAGNHKLFADVLAARLGEDTTSVLMPDFFRGCPIAQPILNSALGFLVTLPAVLYRIKYRHTTEALERDLVHLVYPWIQMQAPTVAEIGLSCVGFCWGGWMVARSLALEDIPMKCGVGVHPSFKVESLHKGYEEDLVKRIGTKPIRLLPAKNDPGNLKVGGMHVKALAEARGVPESEISTEFPSMKHGWVSRGGRHPDVGKCQEEAMQIIVDFLEKNHA